MTGNHDRSPAEAAPPGPTASDPIALIARWEAQSRGERSAADERVGARTNPDSAAAEVGTSVAESADPLCAVLLPAITTMFETVFPDGQIAVQDAAVAAGAIVVEVTFRPGAAADERAAEPADPRITGVRQPAVPVPPHCWVEGISDGVAAG